MRVAIDGFGATVRVILNSLGFFVLLFLGISLFKYSVLWSVVLFLSAIDQFEDVYYYVSGSRLIPTWFSPIDIILEGVLALAGISMAIFGLIYWYSFDSWFFFLWMVASVGMAWSALEDIAEDIKIMGKSIGVGAEKHVARIQVLSGFRFFKRF